MEETGFNRCKKLMIFFNVLFLLCGAALLGLGIWVILDFNSFSGTLNTNSLLFQYASYIAIAVGSVTVLLSLCGCIGAWKENKCLLTLFSVILLLLLVLEIASLVLSFVFTSDVERIISEAAVASIKTQYGVMTTAGSSVTVAWDFTQATTGCCGYNNGTDYSGSLYDVSSTTAQPWPLSCCRLNGTGGYVDSNQCLESTTVMVTNSHALTGCYPELRRLVVLYATVVGGVSVGAMFIQFLAVIFSCCVLSNIDKHGRASAWN